MRKVILAIIIFFASCKKEDVSPAPAPQYKMVFNWGISGFKSDSTTCVKYSDNWDGGAVYEFCDVPVIDSFAISVNEVLTYTSALGYQREFKDGDVLDFYIKGDTDPGAFFYIFQDRNDKRDTLKFYPSGNVISGRINIECDYIYCN